MKFICSTFLYAGNNQGVPIAAEYSFFHFTFSYDNVQLGGESKDLWCIIIIFDQCFFLALVKLQTIALCLKLIMQDFY